MGAYLGYYSSAEIICMNNYSVTVDNFHPRGVLVILILPLQATCFIQSSLLLRCGDIESNPGPGIYPGMLYISLYYDFLNWLEI